MIRSILLFIFSSVLLISCDSGLKFNNPNDPNNKAKVQQGELGGECYPNKTCDEGLTCDKENNICIEESEGSNDNDKTNTEPENGNDEEDTPCTEGRFKCHGAFVSYICRDGEWQFFKECAIDEMCNDTTGECENPDQKPDPTDPTNPTEPTDPTQEPTDPTPDESDSTPDEDDDTDTTPADTGDTGADTGDTGADTGDTGADTGDTGDTGDTADTVDTADTADTADTGDTGADTGDTGADTGDTGADTDPTEPTEPCNPNPCSNVANSTGACTVSGSSYVCGCESDYTWTGSTCKKLGLLTLGNICTGQTSCYNNSSSITCPTSSTADFFGQDAYYASLGKCTARSFTVKTVSNQKVVVDNNTLLEWQQTPSTSTYTWDNAVSYCNNLTYAGYTDWRLPSPIELLSIVDISKKSPAVNTTYFPNMPASAYMWTSKAQTSTTAFDFRPAQGFAYFNISKTTPNRVMCVRGNELPKSSFTSATTNGKVVVTDSTTGQMWQKEAASGKTWQQALKYCEDSTYAGYSDWRLPNRNELSSLLNYDRTSKPYSDFPGLPSSWFWVSSSYTGSNAWYVGFENGYHGLNGTKSRETYVLCVRN